jgi:ribosome-binding factor A
VAFHRMRGPRSPRAGDVRSDEVPDPEVFFGEPDRSRKRNWKVQQLCKQVERAAALTLTSDCRSDVLVGATVAAVAPAPDSARLLVSVVLAHGRSDEHATEARAALREAAPSFRAEVARSIHRKRAPEIVFDVRLAEEVDRG